MQWLICRLVKSCDFMTDTGCPLVIFSCLFIVCVWRRFLIHRSPMVAQILRKATGFIDITLLPPSYKTVFLKCARKMPQRESKTVLLWFTVKSPERHLARSHVTRNLSYVAQKKVKSPEETNTRNI